MRYCIWNNKGGVGKTFLTYSIATEYAVLNPNNKVILIDLCPQANVSEMILGGNGVGESNLEKLYKEDRTVASYIKARYDRARFAKLGSETSYFLSVKEFNDKMPSNLYLLPGDADLDICSSIIDYLALAPERHAWMKSRKILFDLIDSFDQANKNTQNVFFIDCNPSFANYTQLGILSADKMIVPCTADSSSIKGINNLLRLVYGLKIGGNLSEESVFDVFHTKARESGLSLPKIHSFIINKARTTSKSITAAYRAHVKEIENLVSDVSGKYPDLFSEQNNNTPMSVKDGNNVAVVLNHNGQPLSSMNYGEYTIYDTSTQVNKDQLSSLLENIKDIAKHL